VDNLARTHTEVAAVTESGQVLMLEGPRAVVRTKSGSTTTARRAASCLLAPEVGDRVLVATTEDGQGWVVAVLERGATREATIDLEGDVAVRVTNGKLRLVAQEGIDLLTGKDVSVTSGTFRLTAAVGTVVVDQLAYLGRAASAEVAKLKLWATSFDSVLERLSSKVKRSYRTVEELEQLRAERIDWAARKNLSLRGENTLLTAKSLAKMDAEQIHIG